MARVPLPASKVRARRRRRRLVGGLMLGALALVIFAAAVWLSHAPFLRIERVAASGLASVSPARVEALVREHLGGAYGYLFAKDNILLYPQDEIAAALAAEFPEFKAVDVHAQDFSTLAVVVVEREPKALWCQPSSGQCYFMDEDGIIYAPAPSFSEPAYVSYRGRASAGALPRQYLTVDEFHALSAFAGAIAQKETAERVVSVAVDGADDARLAFESGFVLLFSLRSPGGDVFERYALARGAEPLEGRALDEFEYLDLRFGDRLYYKLK